MGDEVDVEAMLDASLQAPPPGDKRPREEDSTGGAGGGEGGGDDKRRRDRSRDRERGRDRSRRDRSRSRSRSRSRRDRDRDRGRDRDRDRSRRDRSPRRRDRRSRSPPPTAAERLKREQERELAELERDLRTVFVYQLHPKAPLKEIFQLFSQAGKVADIRIITDRYTGRSKGFGACGPPSSAARLGSRQLIARLCRRRLHRVRRQDVDLARTGVERAAPEWAPSAGKAVRVREERSGAAREGPGGYERGTKSAGQPAANQQRAQECA
jgi:hypothetical protein